MARPLEAVSEHSSYQPLSIIAIELLYCRTI